MVFLGWPFTTASLVRSVGRNNGWDDSIAIAQNCVGPNACGAWLLPLIEMESHKDGSTSKTRELACSGPRLQFRFPRGPSEQSSGDKRPLLEIFAWKPQFRISKETPD